MAAASGQPYIGRASQQAIESGRLQASMSVLCMPVHGPTQGGKTSVVAVIEWALTAHLFDTVQRRSPRGMYALLPLAS